MDVWVSRCLFIYRIMANYLLFIEWNAYLGIVGTQFSSQWGLENKRFLISLLTLTPKTRVILHPVILDPCSICCFRVGPSYYQTTAQHEAGDCERLFHARVGKWFLERYVQCDSFWDPNNGTKWPLFQRL